MGVKIGLDVGSTNTKAVACAASGEVLGMRKGKSSDPESRADLVIMELCVACGFSVQEIDCITLTGVRAGRITGEVLGRPTRRVDEFVAIGTGGLALSGREQAVVASMGTGIAFILAAGAEARHLGGSGVGGGMLLGMCRHFYALEKFQDIVAASLEGDITHVDLKVGDVIENTYISLPAELTCANFGKISEGKLIQRGDFVLGLINMILETTGVMAVLASQAAGMDKGPVVLIGALAELPQVETVFRHFEERTGVEFVLAEQPLYATAIGAVRS